MKKIIITLVIFTRISSVISQTEHLGVWNSLDEQGNSIYIEFTQNNELKTFKIEKNDTIFGDDANYNIDYSKQPIWLDIDLFGTDMKIHAVVKSIIKIESDSIIIWQKSKNINSRPLQFALDDKETCLILRKAKSPIKIKQYDRFSFLDSSLVEEVLKQCSRETPVIEGKWNPSIKDIISLENNLNNVSKLTSEGCCLSGIQIHNPGYYYRQYAGIIVEGKKMIYINAFSPHFIKRKSTSEIKNLHKRVKVICDGGKSAWGCVYDVKEKEFYSLRVNGVS